MILSLKCYFCDTIVLKVIWIRKIIPMDHILKTDIPAHSLENDVMLFDGLNDKIFSSEFLTAYCTHIICCEGRGQFQLGDKLHQIEKNDWVVWVPGTQASDLMFSPDFKASILLISREFLSEMRPDNKLSLEGYQYALRHPVIRLTDDQTRIFEWNQKALGNRVTDTDNVYYKNIITALAHTLIYDVFNVVTKEINKNQMSNEGAGLFERFLLLVQDNCFTQREVSFYGEKLHVTPKYLSVVCKKSSGKTASDWIDEYTMQHIRMLLKNDKLSIKDITNQMNFSTQSFFGRYVKRILGVSPSEYRQNLNG